MKMCEKRRCNVCGEEWNDTGDYKCRFCGSDDTFIVEDEDEDGSDELWYGNLVGPPDAI